MERIETSLGILHLDDVYCKDRLKSELRGMELLCSIVNSTPVWSFNLNSKKPFLCSNDDGPTIVIDIFGCIQRQLLQNDTHLTVYMSQRPVCILKDNNLMDTPSTDSIVSLVLLGIAGWPIRSTPETLVKKSLETSSYELQDMTKLLPSDYMRVQTALELYDLGVDHASISLLAQMARQWYVCRCWDFDQVRETLEPILERYHREDIEKYLQTPDDASDALFLSA